MPCYQDQKRNSTHKLFSRILKYLVFSLFVYYILAKSSISSSNEALKLTAFIILVFVFMEMSRDKYIKSVCH